MHTSQTDRQTDRQTDTIHTSLSLTLSVFREHNSPSGKHNGNSFGIIAAEEDHFLLQRTSVSVTDLDFLRQYAVLFFWEYLRYLGYLRGVRTRYGGQIAL